ncbi:hypothetical protein VOLCADRAFT_90416 [Volvox carteri f. nagariensis]|uniref:Uncharacterized protein n=1 Tax=Volvox carteri f. nagariensis TaxID=3068 RepID=D8TUB3_VOLCA|nr:uncharacterized protein VOLCADRAFT_90416 [Volvox carteri f. nagariensis]EFJ49009.1 hypothetical protein VOLCADRAFT_90416 [Volvox carteri f. nagariensis]|eukprot:XP_002949906.1 hypothetical protein VOLCADRAFT_90416 [Volvox carteri f. nagariensis]
MPYYRAACDAVTDGLLSASASIVTSAQCVLDRLKDAAYDGLAAAIQALLPRQPRWRLPRPSWRQSRRRRANTNVAVAAVRWFVHRGPQSDPTAAAVFRRYAPDPPDPNLQPLVSCLPLLGPSTSLSRLSIVTAYDITEEDLHLVRKSFPRLTALALQSHKDVTLDFTPVVLTSLDCLLTDESPGVAPVAAEPALPSMLPSSLPPPPSLPLRTLVLSGLRCDWQPGEGGLGALTGLRTLVLHKVVCRLHRLMPQIKALTQLTRLELRGLDYHHSLPLDSTDVKLLETKNDFLEELAMRAVGRAVSGMADLRALVCDVECPAGPLVHPARPTMGLSPDPTPRRSFSGRDPWALLLDGVTKLRKLEELWLPYMVLNRPAQLDELAAALTGLTSLELAALPPPPPPPPKSPEPPSSPPMSIEELLERRRRIDSAKAEVLWNLYIPLGAVGTAAADGNMCRTGAVQTRQLGRQQGGAGGKTGPACQGALSRVSDVALALSQVWSNLARNRQPSVNTSPRDNQQGNHRHCCHQHHRRQHRHDNSGNNEGANNDVDNRNENIRNNEERGGSAGLLAVRLGFKACCGFRILGLPFQKKPTRLLHQLPTFNNNNNKNKNNNNNSIIGVFMWFMWTISTTAVPLYGSGVFQRNAKSRGVARKGDWRKKLSMCVSRRPEYLTATLLHTGVLSTQRDWELRVCLYVFMPARPLPPGATAYDDAWRSYKSVRVPLSFLRALSRALRVVDCNSLDGWCSPDGAVHPRDALRQARATLAAEGSRTLLVSEAEEWAARVMGLAPGLEATWRRGTGYTTTNGCSYYGDGIGSGAPLCVPDLKMHPQLTIADSTPTATTISNNETYTAQLCHTPQLQPIHANCSSKTAHVYIFRFDLTYAVQEVNFENLDQALKTF